MYFIEMGGAYNTCGRDDKRLTILQSDSLQGIGTIASRMLQWADTGEVKLPLILK
jgi:hypothetical protein